MKKILIFILVTSIICVKGFAQQYPQYSHYMFNKSGLNPGYTGMSELVCVNVISHNQWLGWDKSPKTQLLTIDTPLNLFGLEHGVGLSMFSDNQGFEKNFSLKLGYSFHKSVAGGKLGIGFDAGIFNKTIDADFEFPEVPEALFTNFKQKIVFDLGVGAFYEYDNIYTGLSVMNLNRAKLDYNSEGEFQLENHYIFTAGYNIQLANALIDLSPSFLIKSDLVTLEYDLNLLLTYNKKIWGGVTYRKKDALVFFAGAILYNNIKLGLAYDLTLTNIQTVSNGTFEVYVGYAFDFIKPISVKQYRSVRFL